MLKARQDFRDAQDAMMKRRGQLLSRLNRAHDPIVGRLPPEIASLILQFCVPTIPFNRGRYYGYDNDEDDRRATDDNMDGVRTFAVPLVVLASVCQDWRRAVRSTPRLWQSISVRLDLPNLELYTDIIQDWLKRSRGLPLSIRVYCCHWMADVTPPVKDVVDAINQESSRWQTLDLRMSSKLATRFGGKNCIQSSILESLRFQRHGRLGWNSEVALQTSDVMLSPRQVFLEDVNPGLFTVCWDNVVWLGVDLVSFRGCLELLQRVPRLKCCRCYPFPPHTDEVIPAGIITLHELEELRYEYPELDIPEYFFDHVSFPSLKVLELKVEFRLAHAALCSFFARSSCSLVKLTIENAFFSNQEIFGLLKVLPSLVELRLMSENTRDEDEVDDFDDEFFFTLFARTSLNLDEKSQFLPNLQVLHYRAQEVFRWESILPVYGPISEPNSIRRRPLKIFHLYMDEDINDSSIPVIDKQFIVDMLAVKHAGLEFKLLPNDRSHLIEEAMKRFGVEVET